jgi:hypothetical protein
VAAWTTQGGGGGRPSAAFGVEVVVGVAW